MGAPDVVRAGWRRARLRVLVRAPELVPARGEEHRAAREAVALFDLSSFAKTEVAGPTLCGSFSSCARTTSTCLRETRLHVVPEPRRRYRERRDRDRLDDDRFLVITPTAMQHRTIEWPRAHGDGMSVAIDDVTSSSATLADGTAQPGAARARRTPISRMVRSRSSRRNGSRVANAPALAIRASFVGELGWELYVSPSTRCTPSTRSSRSAAISAYGSPATTPSTRCGSRRTWATTWARPTTFSAGLGHVVQLDRDFVGAEAARVVRRTPAPRRLREPRPRRSRTGPAARRVCPGRRGDRGRRGVVGVRAHHRRDRRPRDDRPPVLDDGAGTVEVDCAIVEGRPRLERARRPRPAHGCAPDPQ